MKAAVPGKGGRRGAGRPGLGGGHRTRLARPFVRLSGAARIRALPGTRRGRAGARWARRGRGEAPAEERAPDRLQPGLGAARAPSPSFSAGGFHLRETGWCQVSPLLRAGGRIRSQGAGSPKPVPPTLSSFPEYTLGIARWELRPQLVPFCPAPSAAVFKISQFLLGLGSSGFPYSIRKLV